MLVIPAIDLWEGNVVRLVKGDPSCSKVYSSDPIEIAFKWKNQGVPLLHIVDLSAAFGKPDNFEWIEKIAAQVPVKIQVGGGIRDIKKAEKLISLGVERIILGTRGIDEKFLDELIDAVGIEKIAVSIDVKNSFFAVEAWQKTTDLRAIDVVRFLNEKGIRWIIYTDISRDGTLQGINLEDMKEFSSFSDINFILSGGVSSMEDIQRIEKETPFIWGAISGKALYEGMLNLKDIF